MFPVLTPEASGTSLVRSLAASRATLLSPDLLIRFSVLISSYVSPVAAIRVSVAQNSYVKVACRSMKGCWWSQVRRTSEVERELQPPSAFWLACRSSCLGLHKSLLQASQNACFRVAFRLLDVSRNSQGRKSRTPDLQHGRQLLPLWSLHAPSEPRMGSLRQL